jgi:septal ring-binding cell division protein DamX
MVSMKVKVLVLLLLVGLFSACASPATSVPASPPSEAAAPAITSTQPTEAATSAPDPTATSAPESSPTSEPASGATISFANDVLPILESRCVNCHGGDRTEEDLSLKNYGDLRAGSKNGAVVIPSDADHSKLAELIINQKMPKRGPKLTPPQIQLIVDWINQGALEN